MIKTTSKRSDANQDQISSTAFAESYNKNMPAGFPRVTETLLQKFKDENPSIFKHGDLWSLDEHRKKIVDWFQNLKND